MDLNKGKIMKALKTYYVTDKAGRRLNGTRHGGVGSPVEMTEAQAKPLIRGLQITETNPKAKVKLDAKPAEAGFGKGKGKPTSEAKTATD